MQSMHERVQVISMATQDKFRQEAVETSSMKIKKKRAAYSVARGGMTAELNDFLWSESHFSVQLGVQVIQSYLLFYKVSQQLQRQTKRSDMTYWEKQFTPSVSQIFNRPT